MKKFRLYVLCWTLILGLFNLLVFIIPAWPTLEKYTASFWIGWGAAIVAFVGQLICAWFAFSAGNAKKTFYNVSLYTVSYIGLIAMFVAAMICIVITPLPYWIAAIACSIVLVANIVDVVKARMAVEAVVDVDTEVENATAFIYDMREESESLFARVKGDETKKTICKKIRDAFKFSDPMSKTEFASIENDIKTHFCLFSQAILDGEMDVATLEADETLALISKRNNICMKLK